MLSKWSIIRSARTWDFGLGGEWFRILLRNLDVNYPDNHGSAIKLAHQDLRQETHRQLTNFAHGRSFLWVSHQDEFQNCNYSKEHLFHSISTHDNPQKLSNTEQFTSARTRISDPLKTLRLFDCNKWKQKWWLASSIAFGSLQITHNTIV